jgi:hypothetical protein
MIRREGRSLAEEFEPGGRYAEGGQFAEVGAYFRFIDAELSQLSAAGVPRASLQALLAAQRRLVDFFVRDDLSRPHRYVITDDSEGGDDAVRG